MVRTRSWFVVVSLVLGCGQAVAADLGTPVAVDNKSEPSSAIVFAQDGALAQQPPAAAQPGAIAPKGPRPPEQPATPLTDSLTQGPPSGGEAPGGGFNPHMMGDFPGYLALRQITIAGTQTTTTITTNTQTTQMVQNIPSTVTTVVQVPTQIIGPNGQPMTILVPVRVTVPVTNTVTTVSTTTTQVPMTTQQTVGLTTLVRVPVVSHGAFKIAENESPRPTDRVFVTYDFYSNVTGPLNGLNFPRVETQTTIINGNPTTITTLNPGVTAAQVDVHREVFGFEKTFFGGSTSIGLRAPVLQEIGGFGDDSFGDITLISKYAFLDNWQAGDVVSGGLALTVPTGPEISTVAGNFHSVLFQPYVAFLWNLENLYVQGFVSVVIPTDSRDVTFLFNDIGVGYAIYRGTPDRLLTLIAPTVEAHVTTPLDNRQIDAPLRGSDLVVLTEGLHFGFRRNSTLTIGAATPVTGPRLFDVEAIAQFNWRF
jgi:hypothetical protein